MTRPLLLLLLTVLLTALPACITPAMGQRSNDRHALLERIEQFNSSIRDGDKEGYADVFVDDFVFTWSRDGQIYDRESILPNVVPTPDYAPLVDEHIVRIYGDAAIVNYRVRKQPEDEGVRVTFSYARIDDEWKVIASHSTAIEESADETAETEDAE